MKNNLKTLSKEDSLEIELSHAREALQEIYLSLSVEEIHDIVYKAADKMTNGSPEKILEGV